ncbi:DTW domain-containing protein [Shewanella sp. OPT22]|nr:DTW domain-containing protein [Shewanella sp. OPT22]
MKPIKHRIHDLYTHRKSLSTKTFNARGKNVSRCKLCLQNIKWCICDHRRQLASNASFLLLMYDDEVLKPSNTGRLIADLIPETFAFLWSRVEVEQKLLDLIQDPEYQPVLIFPDEYAETEIVYSESSSLEFSGKKTLFILLDGTWREAIKMYRKSEYLRGIPMLSFSPEFVSEYVIRKGQRDFQLGTAEVAAMALECFGEKPNAEALKQWSNVFKESALLGRNKRPISILTPFSEYIEQFEMAHEKAIMAKLD